jgi:Ser/Thr protein kinase RdoA (MazF antagonist)
VLADHVDEIVRAFGLGSPASAFVLAGRGEEGLVWRLETDVGRFAIKELRQRQVEGDADASVRFQEAAFAAGVTVPRPRRTVAGRVLASVGPHQVRAYGWVDLRPVDQSADPVLIGATVAAIHRVHHEPARPLHPWYTQPVGAARWRQLYRDARAAGAPFADGLGAELATLIALEKLMQPPRALQNCHRDLWADNILPMAHGGVCVIDWENCGLEDPAQELPMLLIDFAWGDAARMQALFGSYVDAGGPGRLKGRGTFTMVIAQFGHFWESAVVTYLAPSATAEQKTHSVERADLQLRQPLRVHDVDDILDALAGR